MRDDYKTTDDSIEVKILGSYWSENPIEIEKVRQFLHYSMLDLDNFEQVKENVSFAIDIKSNLENKVEGLLAIEKLVNETDDIESLYQIVTWDANYMIHKEEAKIWLLEFAEFVRDIVRDELKDTYGDLFDEEEDMPPRKYPLVVSRPRKYFFPE